MTINANWEISGIKFENSINAFVKSGEHAVQPQVLKKYQPQLNKQFKQYIQDNTIKSGIDADNFGDIFSLVISNNGVNFINTEPLITQRYEYGYYEDDTVKDNNHNNNEEFFEEYMIQTSPKYFIRPSIQQSLNDIGNMMLNEAKKDYTNNRGQEVNER